jgi:hypothetical protein
MPSAEQRASTPEATRREQGTESWGSSLPGRLAGTTLGDLLGTLHRACASGVLELVERHGPSAGQSHRVFLRAGVVDGVETPHVHPPLGELLASEGALDRHALGQLLLKLTTTPERRAGEILVSERLASEALVGAALRWQLRARLESLFRLQDASVRFHVRSGLERGRLGAVLTPREFLHGRSRARPNGGSRAVAEARAETARAEACRLLGVAADADAESLRRAYRRLAREHHPDRHPGASAAELARLVRDFTRITAAYRTATARQT